MDALLSAWTQIYSPVQLANYLKLLRQQNHWTQEALASRIG
ncbi:type II toxin-antitoxin system antitoxin HipB, partial [Klebsiella quasipneumoniae]